MSKIKLYLDEDVRPLLAKILRNRGYDVTSCVERKHFGFSDEKQLNIASKNKRAILTHNIKDFVLLHKKTNGKHFGIIVSEQTSISILLKRILKLLSQNSATDINGNLIWLNNYK